MKVVFDKAGIPHCGSLGCGSLRFDCTLIVIDVFVWELESAYCARCGQDVELIPELVDYIEAKAWIVKGPDPRTIQILG